MLGDKTIWIDVTGPKAETDKAILLDVDGEEHWLPRSHIGARKRDPKTKAIVRIEISVWLAQQIGIRIPKTI